MFVIIQHGGRQYWAEQDSTLILDKIDGNIGDKLDLNVMFTSSANNMSTVQGTITKHYKGDKIVVFKKKKRHRYERKIGHRQQFTNVKIDLNLDSQNQEA